MRYDRFRLARRDAAANSTAVARCAAIGAALACAVTAGVWSVARPGADPGASRDVGPAALAVPASSARRLVWIDRAGRQTRIPAPPRGYAYPRLSPDGGRIALDIRDERHGIWLWDVARAALTPFTVGRASDIAPVWSHDGRWILFARGRGVAPGLFRRAVDDAASAEPLPGAGDTLLMPTALSPDDAYVVATASVPSGFDLVGVTLAPGGGRVSLAATPWDELNGDVSPDGRWVAYQSRASGQFEIWLRPLANGAPAVQATTNGGRMPVWSRHGAEILYLHGEGEIWTLSPQRLTGSGPGQAAPDAPRRLFAVDLFADLVGRTFDVTPEGDRIVAVIQGGAGPDR